ERVTAAKPRPKGRNGAALILDAKRNRLLLHGGDGGPNSENGFTPLDDLWEFSLSKHSWRRLQTAGVAPEPRWNHARAIDDRVGGAYLFGGAGYVGERIVRDNVIFNLNLDDLKGGRLECKGSAPTPVEGTSLTFDEQQGALLVAGGLSLADE